MREIIKKVTEMYEDKGRREDKSPCSKVKNIADIMVKKLEHLIEHPSVRRRAEKRLPGRYQ